MTPSHDRLPLAAILVKICHYLGTVNDSEGLEQAYIRCTGANGAAS